MARIGFSLTEGTVLADATTVPFTHGGNDGGTALAAAVATAVADGATPTQAHVTAINTALPTVQGDVNVSYDAAKITNANQLKAALDRVLAHAIGSGLPRA